MKKAMSTVLLLLLLLFCLWLGSSSADGEYSIQFPEAAVVGLGENLTIPFTHPAASYQYLISVSCSDPDAMDLYNKSISQYYSTANGYFYVRMQKKGQYTLSFTAGDDFSYEIVLTVEDKASAIHASTNRFVMQAGETIDPGFETVGGVLYNTPYLTHSNSGIVSFSADRTAMTALKPGFTEIVIKIGTEELGRFDVVVVSPSEQVSLSASHPCGAVDLLTTLEVKDKDGNRVTANIQLTEGSENAKIVYYPNYVCLLPTAPGWVTVTAWGTDGSSDSLRLRIYEKAERMDVALTTDQLPAGQQMQIAVTLPEGTWAPVTYEFWDHMPAQTGISGPVALVSEDGLVTGLVPGTCTLRVKAGSLLQRFTLTVTDSDQAIRIIKPEPAFDWRTPFQLAVMDRTGQAIPAVFSIADYGNAFSIDSQGVLTASRKATGTLAATLENGARYTFSVKAVDTPAWLKPSETAITLPLDYTYSSLQVTADIQVTNSMDLVLCSGDESIVKINGWTIVPQQIGTAVLTVWSRYSDVHCNLIVTVTEPVGELYVNGVQGFGDIFVPYNGTVKLPAVTDRFGTPVKVNWQITNPSGNWISFAENRTALRASATSGVATVIGTAANGQTMKLTAYPYIRSTNASFVQSENTIQTGSRYQVDFQWDSGSNGARLYPNDISFTLTGDTDCVQMEPRFDYYTFVGLREGTVTLKVTLYNKKTITSVVHVVTAPTCQNGHDPVWVVLTDPTESYNGLRGKRCSRCGVPLDGQEVIPCTGALGFAHTDYYVCTEGYGQLTALGTHLSGDRRQSFTWRSSDPDTVEVLADTVVGLRPGTATITVTKNDCAPATCRVHVLEPRILQLPAELQTIEDGAFQGIAATSVRIPNQVTSIGHLAFAYCPYLMEVIIPASVTQIAEDAFLGSPWVTIVFEEADGGE